MKEKSRDWRDDKFYPSIHRNTITFCSEPLAQLTRKGYFVMADIQIDGESITRRIYLSSQSIAAGLAPLIAANNNSLSGVKVVIYKQSEDQYARTVVEPIFPAEKNP